MFGVKTKTQRRREKTKHVKNDIENCTIYKRSEGKRNDLTCELINTSSWLCAFWASRKFIPAFVIYTHTHFSNEKIRIKEKRKN